MGSPAADELELGCKTGWLWLEVRRMTRTTWMEAWVTLQEGTLRFFDDMASRRPIGSIDLGGAEVSSCRFARTDHCAFRVSHGKHHFVLAAETEEESFDWAESLIEHGAMGLLRSLSVKPKASMSFKSFGRSKLAGANSDGSLAAESRFKSMRSFGRSKLDQKKPPSSTKPQPSLTVEPPAEAQREDEAAMGRRRRDVHFAEEHSAKRLSVGDKD